MASLYSLHPHVSRKVSMYGLVPALSASPHLTDALILSPCQPFAGFTMPISLLYWEAQTPDNCTKPRTMLVAVTWSLDNCCNSKTSYSSSWQAKTSPGKLDRASHNAELVASYRQWQHHDKAGVDDGTVTAIPASVSFFPSFFPVYETVSLQETPPLLVRIALGLGIVAFWGLVLVWVFGVFFCIF